MPKPPNSSTLALALRLGAYLAFAAILVVFALAAPGFLTLGNWLNVLQQSAILGLLAFGLAVVVIGGGGDVVTGGIDLSVAANLGLCAAVYASLIRGGYSDAVALASTLAAGLGVGALNAFAVTALGIAPLLATLAVAKITSGLEFVLKHNSVVTANSPLLSWLADNGAFSVPIMAYVLVVSTLIAWGAAQATPWGLRLQTVGAHREAARAAGLPVKTYIAGTYLVSGLFGALAGVLSAAYLSGSSPGSADILLSVVVAALLGVVFSPRLTPNLGGAALAVLFIGLLNNGFQLVNVSSYWVSGVEGALILFVVACTPSQRGAVS